MRDLKTQFASALLFVLTVAAVCCAVINFRQQSLYHLPDDGVTWVDRPGSDGQNQVLALHVTSGSQGANAGIRPGDVLLEVASQPIATTLDVPKALQKVGFWLKAEYIVRRGGVSVPMQVLVAEGVLLDRSLYYQYAVGIAYLLIGLFVYYRRVGAPRSVHFYVLCLTSFILSTFHFTGKLNAFDQAIYWGNVVAGALAPTIFLHFCLVFPERPQWLRRGSVSALLYVPAAMLLAVYVLVAKGMLRIAASPVEVGWLLDRVWLLLLSAFYLIGTGVLAYKTPQADDPLVRRQLKYMRNGCVLGLLPFIVVYALPYVFGGLPGHYQKMAVLSLILLPVTWAYAILRYRLMDVDIIFQQGYVYTLATLVVLGIFYGLIFSFARPEDLSPAAIVGLIIFATFIFQPIRDWLQEQLDRYFFYKDRYDYRRTLIEFARELGSETNLDEMLRSVGDRLVHTLSIQHVAFFLAGEDDQFQLHMTQGVKKDRGRHPQELDLSFLVAHPGKPYLFFERTRHLLDAVSKQWTPSVRQTIAELDLTYYFACSVRGRTIAYIALSRTDKGDFLPSDDVELIITLAGYVAIAVENSRLYSSLQRKVEENERLKEFNENIVESINVGILAADLNDCVESWNNQIERLTGVPREAAVGRPLAALFPRELCDMFDQVRGQTGVHNIYKFVLPAPAGVNGNGNGHHNGNGNGNANGNGNGHSKSSSPHILNLAIAPLVSKDMQQIGRLIIFDDITDRDELERRLVQADKLSSIGLLAAGVAHEVNTPLAVISTYAQMLAKQISEDEQKSKLLDKIAKQTFRASEIVNSLLSFSRTSPTEFVEVDVSKVIQETLNLIDHQLKKSHVEVKLDAPAAMPAVKGNSGKLQQVFLNLFLNARDAMEVSDASGGTLTVRASTEGGFARIDVSDTGQGISAEHMERIYDPFFTTKAARKGTGLGLSVTYGIVREHGGTIEVESRLGAGSRFRVELPLARKPVHA
ncbi:MAG TPA: ATP-binding protein [Bryobacteraceae bacterium]|nr:ATP-binding protein [Bryobacteraceae bacterium]